MPRFFMQIDAAEVESIFDRIDQALAENIDNGDVYEGYRDADSIYMQAQKQSFLNEGDGGWQELAGSTKKDRARQGYPEDHPMLQRSKVLAHAFDRGAPGNVFRVEKDHIETGLGGPARHPGYPNKRGGTITIGALAAIQHYGTDKIPARPLLRDPTDQLLKQMAAPIVAGYSRAIQAAIKG